jgi:hypothetical protein
VIREFTHGEEDTQKNVSKIVLKYIHTILWMKL